MEISKNPSCRNADPVAGEELSQPLDSLGNCQRGDGSGARVSPCIY
jgi:hypothetical protein